MTATDPDPATLRPPTATNRDVSPQGSGALRTCSGTTPVSVTRKSNHVEKTEGDGRGAASPQGVAGYMEKHDEIEDDTTSTSSSTPDLESSRRPDNVLKRHATQSIVACPYVAAPVTTDGERQDGPALSRPPSIASSVSLEPEPNDPASRVSTDAHGNTYPEGGRDAFLCVFGSLCGLMAALGMMNTIGTYQAYLSHNQLQGLSEGKIGWIFGIYAFLSFFLGIQIGPVFDAYGAQYLILAGSVLLTVGQLLLAQSTQYWHFILSFGVLGGIGTSLIFTPGIAALGHHFLRRRGQFVGLACVGGSLGGIIFPLALQAMFPKIGFTWACRVVALLNLVLLIPANFFIRGRLPRKARVELQDILPDPLIFRGNSIFTFTTLSVFFVEWALFIPISYAPSYCLSHGIDSTLSYQLLAVLNAGSCFGRYIPGLIADRIGRFNAMILTIASCVVLVFALWLPAGGSLAPLIIFLVLFGFASGSGISLTPVCVGQLCKTENLGRYYATCYTVASFATLTGIPIAGSLLTLSGYGNDIGNANANSNGNEGDHQGNWLGLLLFTGVAYVAALVCLIIARVLGVGWRPSKIY